MKRKLLFCLFCLFTTVTAFCADGIVGFWNTIDEKTGQARCIVAIYEYDDRYYGRIIATYTEDGKVEDSIDHPITRAPGVRGEPYYAGLDIIWNLQPKGNGKYANGKIMDPEKGKIYNVEVWRSGDDLIVRGQLLFFGRNQTWLPVTDNMFPKNVKKPDLNNLVPVIPYVK